MAMDKTGLMDHVLDMLSGDMDDLEGKSAMEHSQEECPDPLTCKMHDGELGDNVSKEPMGLEIEVKKIGGMPSLDGAKEETPAEEVAEHEGKAEEGLSPAEAEELRKLLK